MIVHLVFFRFAENADGRTAAENMEQVKAKLEALPVAIPELRELSCGPDESRTPASFDFGLYTTFASWEDLETYRVHPAHQAVVELIKVVTTDRAVVDFEHIAGTTA